MAIVSRTVRQMRQALYPAILQRDEFILADDGAPSVPTAAGTGTTTFANLSGAGNMLANHWAGGEIRGETSGNAVVTGRIISNTAAGVVTHTTLAGAVDYAGDPSTIEMVRAPHSIAAVTRLLRDANNELVKYSFVEDTSYLTLASPGRYIYPVPTANGTWVYLCRVEANFASCGGDRYVPTGPDGQTQVSAIATTRRRAQGFTLYDTPRIAAVWLRLRKAGTLTGTMTVTINADSSGVPGSAATGGTSDSVNISVVDTDWTWTRFAFSATPNGLSSQTAYHIVLNPSSLSTLGSSNFIEWSGSTQGGYAGGEASTSTDSGSSYTADTAQQLHFILESTEPDWQPVDLDDFYAVPDSTRRWGLRPWALRKWHVPLRLTGLRKAADLSADTTTCELDAIEVQRMAEAMWLENPRYGNNPALGQYFRQLAIANVTKNATRVPPGAKLLEVA